MLAERKHPHHGVNYRSGEPVIVFLTVCTDKREAWLANESTHELLRRVWSEARAWLVGRYVVMPNHVHLFAAPGELEIEFDSWVRYWKSQFTRLRGEPQRRLQVDHWDTRIRSAKAYEEKWEYVRHNPVRAGLVTNPEDWPYQGELNSLDW